MPWYHVVIDHGKGHMSRTEWYEWFTMAQTKTSKEYYLKDECDRRWIRSPQAYMNRVHKLPKQEMANQKAHYKRAKGHAERMLKIIKGTEALK